MRHNHDQSRAIIDCPKCGKEIEVPLYRKWKYFLGDAAWDCPHCSHQFSTTELHAYEQRGPQS